MTRSSTRLLALAAVGAALISLASAAAADPTPRARDVALSEDDRAWLRAHRVVKVGVTDTPWPPYDLLSEDGEHRGITADYLDLLATRADFRVERIRFKTFPEAFQALRTGGVDMLGSMARTPDRETVASFTAPYATSPSVILTRKDDTSIRSVKDLDGKKIALERGYAAHEFLKKAAPGAVIVDVTTTLEALQAVSSGDADAYTGSLVTSGYLIEKNYLTNLEVRASSGFPTTELRFAVRKDLPRLAKVLDAAIRGLGESDHDRIRARWIPGRGTGTPGTAVELTAAERAWIGQHPRVRVGVLPNRRPLDILEKDGRHSGMGGEYLGLLRDRLGLDFEAVAVADRRELAERLRNRELDMASLIIPNSDRAAYLAFTRPVFSMPWVIVTATDAPFITGVRDLRGKPVAAVDGNAAHVMLSERFPDVRIVIVASDVEGLEAITQGRAVALAAPLATVSPVIQQQYASSMKVAAPLPEVPPDFVLAVRNDWVTLRDILDKGIATITDEEQGAIRSRWLGVTYRLTLEWRRYLGVLIPLGATVGLVILVIAVWNRRLRSQISQRRKAEAALSNQLSFQEVLFDTVPSALFFKDTQRRFIGCNRAFEEMFGVSRGDLMDKTLLDFTVLPPEQRESLHADEAVMLETRESRFNEVQVRLADGRTHELLFWSRTFDLANGRIGGILGALLDITDRKEAEQQIATQFRTLQTLLENMPDGVALVDRDLQVAASNAKFREVLDLPAALFDKGRSSFERLVRFNVERGEYGDADPGAITARLLDASRRAALHHEERTRPNGQVLEIRGAPLPDGGFVRFYTDITERKRAEVALANAKDAADEASRAKSSFLATMSHEIRTPMNGVLGMLELLSLSRLEAEQRATLNTARESARSLLGIIDDILDVSKIEAGRLELRPEPTSVAQVVEGVFLVYSVVASRKNLLLMRTVDPRISPAHMVDPLRLRQILNNFTSNALKFTAEGHVEIRAELLERIGESERVRFSVRDTGIGISPENQQKLFQPFVQAEGDTTRRFGGTGLGLAICRRLADMMGGQVEMQSDVGKGTTMTLTLTLPIGDPAQVTAADALGGPGHAAAHLAGRRAAPSVAAAAAERTLVLVVDDHPTNRSLLERQLKALGYASETAENGVEALGKWSSGRFAVVITDCHMPEMDGYDLTRAIRREEAERSLARMPVIACTANALPGEADICFAAGMDDYLAKPVEMAALARAVDRWLPIPSAGAPASGTASTASDVEAGPSPIEPGPLAELTGGDQAMERDILLEYRTANDADVAALTEALARNDLPGVVRAAHRIKGASRMVGAGALAAVCASIEQAGRQEDWEAVRAEEDRLRRVVERLTAYLTSLEAGGR